MSLSLAAAAARGVAHHRGQRRGRARAQRAPGARRGHRWLTPKKGPQVGDMMGMMGMMGMMAMGLLNFDLSGVVMVMM